MQPMIVVYSAMAVALLITLVVGLRGAPMQAGLFATVVAAPLQLMGLTSTCTQGADGTFITGAILSAPFVLMATGLFFWASYRRRLDLTAGAISLTAAVALVFLTRDAWIGSLMFGTPCGEVFSLYPSDPATIVVIVGAYAALPSLLIVGAGLSVANVLRRGTGKSLP